MSSTSRVDYSIRQNKAIERGIVFDGLRALYTALHVDTRPIYVGFGSVWFTDFHLAHRILGIDDMVSIELDSITATRAEFNKPYRTIEVIPGDSIDVIPMLLARTEMLDRPWIVWLDFDQALDDDRMDQIDELIRNMPADSSLITTFSGTPGRYGKPTQRPQALSTLFGFAVAEAPSIDSVRDENGLSQYLANTLSERILSVSIEAGRPPAQLAFKLKYKDGTPMITVGAILPAEESEHASQAVVTSSAWPGIVDHAITTPPLTSREVGAIRALLPASRKISRADIQACGFDLEDDQLDAFTAHYTRYPAFAQLAF